jgi:para-nitrobenzyl esterase
MTSMLRLPERQEHTRRARFFLATRSRRPQALAVVAALAVACTLLASPVAAQGPFGAGTASSMAAARPLVATDSGAIRGQRVGDVDQFLGVPYAAPPVGSLRWRPPAPAAAWRPRVRDATRLPTPCPQMFVPGGMSSPATRTAEDCLYLNIYRPVTSQTTTPVPVLVFIPGGAFINGTSNLYDGSALAARSGMVVVTVNYRLNVFGFLALPALTREAPDHSSGNYGLLDQQAALRWVQRNIAAFGGDPRNVTIDGQSAGAISVCAQLASPTARGLFARAIIESGNCLANTLAQAERAGEKFAAALGCTNATTAAACLRAKPAALLLAKSAANALPADAPLPGGPNVSGSVLPVLPRQAIAAGAWHRVPVMIGSTHDEWRPLIPYVLGFPGTPQAFRALLSRSFGPLAPRVLAAYSLHRYSAPAYALGAIYTDTGAEFGIGSCETQQLAGLFSASAPTYSYEVTDRHAPAGYWFAPPGYQLGSAHGADLTYLFAYRPRTETLTATQEQFAGQLQGYWASFARSGDPNAGGRVAWPRYSRSADQVLALRPAGIAVITNFTADHHCTLWDSLAGG